MERFLTKHGVILQFIGGIVATALSLTVYAYTNFATKEELKNKAEGLSEKNLIFIQEIERRLDRIEAKQDILNERLLKK
jgi:hypothetical protein